ncbi:MAG: hypothetical protein WDW38_005062 [Sanguina aurantia]
MAAGELSTAESHEDRRVSRKRGLHSGILAAAQDERCVEPRIEAEPVPALVCGICLEDITAEDVYCIESCQHRFCRPCLSTYTRGLISEHRFPLQCPHPGCSHSISTTQVSELLGNQQDVDTLQRLEVESCIPDSSKFYCPNPGCSMLLIVDEQHPAQKQQQQQASRCPVCQETVCVACKVLWHDNMTCSEYQSLPTEMRRPEDTETVTLQAKDAGWKACPRCRNMVELAHGCYHIVCNCGCNWCYKCGNAWSGVGAGCGCLLWDRENVALEETFRTQHYQAHGQDESHARQMAADDLMKYGLTAAAGRTTHATSAPGSRVRASLSVQPGTAEQQQRPRQGKQSALHQPCTTSVWTAASLGHSSACSCPSRGGGSARFWPATAEAADGYSPCTPVAATATPDCQGFAQQQPRKLAAPAGAV